MLIRFGVQNHRSIRDAQEISFARSALKGPEHVTVPAHGTKRGVLPVMALYGANASGKTSVLSALRFMVGHIVDSHVRRHPGEPLPQMPFKLDPVTAAAPTRFDIDVLVDEVHYHYGFSFSAAGVDEEWLYAWPSGHQQLWFHRVGADPADWKLGSKLTGPKAAIASFTRENSLFLSAAAQNNHPQLTPLYTYFQTAVRFQRTVRPGERVLRPGSPLFEPAFRSAVVQMLQAADLGIVGAQVTDRRGTVVEQLRRGGLADLADGVEESPDAMPELELGHANANGDVVWFDPGLESAGTLMLLHHLHEALPALQHGWTLVVDEIDVSLHPALIGALIRVFADRKLNRSGAQLLFTTHDQTILDVLRRDEVVIVDKGADGATTLTPLSDFKTLAREDTRRAYAEGRYGGVPRLGRFGGIGAGG